jgi:hypothetical protein
VVSSRDLYLTTHNTHNRETSMLPVRFEPTVSNGERPQTFALDRAAPGSNRSDYKKGKEIPLEAWTGLEGSRRMMLPDFKTVGT